MSTEDESSIDSRRELVRAAIEGCQYLTKAVRELKSLYWDILPDIVHFEKIRDEYTMALKLMNKLEWRFDRAAEQLHS